MSVLLKTTPQMTTLAIQVQMNPGKLAPVPFSKELRSLLCVFAPPSFPVRGSGKAGMADEDLFLSAAPVKAEQYKFRMNRPGDDVNRHANTQPTR